MIRDVSEQISDHGKAISRLGNIAAVLSQIYFKRTSRSELQKLQRDYQEIISRFQRIQKLSIRELKETAVEATHSQVVTGNMEIIIEYSLIYNISEEESALLLQNDQMR